MGLLVNVELQFVKKFPYQQKVRKDSIYIMLLFMYICNQIVTKNVISIHSSFCIMDVAEKSPKFYEITTTARKLFWKHGIRRVTVEEICQEASVSKMTFYRMFDNKIELVKTVLNEMMEDSMSRYRRIMAQDIPFADKIRQTILLKLEGTQEISEELLKDIYKNEEPALMAFMAEKRKQSMDEVFQNLTNAQRHGWIRKDIKPEFILYIINKISEMGTDDALLAIYPNTQQAIMELTNFFFYGILPESRPDA